VALRLLDESPGIIWRTPHCFSYELPNLLLRQERRNLLPPGATESAMGQIVGTLGVVWQAAPGRRLSAVALELARVHRVSLFDGFYLQLALELAIPLATRDGLLAEAATREMVDVIDVRAVA
jgi:predicted nucleic acid-binding protein